MQRCKDAKMQNQVEKKMQVWMMPNQTSSSPQAWLDKIVKICNKNLWNLLSLKSFHSFSRQHSSTTHFAVNWILQWNNHLQFFICALMFITYFWINAPGEQVGVFNQFSNNSLYNCSL